MASAKIGALHVSLGLDSASFTKGLEHAQGKMSKFGVQVTLGLETIVGAVGRLANAFPSAIKGAIDHADAIAKAAQKAGVATESLSRLEYAAKLSDVSLEQLTGGLARLAKSLADVAAGGQGPAATAFAALGINVKDAAGQLRASDEVFAEVADRFGRMEDGSTKTALAMGLFGKAGAELIPLLNSGRDGLKAMADESDRLGQTISGSTARGAEAFNDTLTRIGAIMSGVVNQIMQGVLPSLQAMANRMASPEFAAAAKSLGDTVGGVLNWIVIQAGNVVTALQGIGKQLDFLSTHDMFGNRLADSKPGDQAYNRRRWGPGGAQNQLSDALKAGSMSAPDEGFFAGIFGGGETAMPSFGLPDASAFEGTTQGLQGVIDKAGEAKGSIAELGVASAGAAASMGKDLDWTNDKFAGFLSQTSGLLDQIFKDNKAAAIASAVLDAGAGIAKTMGAYPYPANMVLAGMHAAAAVSQIAAISATTPNSTSLPGGVPSVAAPEVPMAAAGRSMVINLHGNANTPTTLGMVGGLLEQLKEELSANGQQLVISYKGS